MVVWSFVLRPVLVLRPAFVVVASPLRVGRARAGGLFLYIQE